MCGDEGGNSRGELSCSDVETGRGRGRGSVVQALNFMFLLYHFSFCHFSSFDNNTNNEALPFMFLIVYI